MKYNLANNEPLEINGDIYVKGVGTYDGTNAGESGVKTLKDILNSGVTEITWSNLVDLRNNNELIPGQYYRITDYTCTTNQGGTKSAGHVFDIIVRADSENKLNEEASAALHTGDTYFTNSNLSAWRLWYCLDNDTTRFAWADGTNGKGVIYRMIDEFNNDVPYDFKNIQFYRQWDSSKSLWSIISYDSTGVPCYTFSSEGNSSTTSFTDMSLSISNSIYSNVIKKYVSSKKQTLNNNCFFGKNYYNNSFGSNCYFNTFGNNCNENTFGNGCLRNTFGNNCYENTFGNNCCENTFGNYCYYNTFGNYYYYNTFGNNFRYNTFGYSCLSNTFGNNCYSNIFGNYCHHNTFGNNCQNNTFGNDCYNNSFGDDCKSNSFGNSCSYNSFGDDCKSNSFGNSCSYNSFRVIASSTSELKSYVYYNHFDDGCSYNVIWNSDTTSSSVLLKNINVNRGVVGTSSSYNMINIDTLNSEQEINVNQVDGIASIEIKDIILSITYESLKTLRDSSKLIPGQQYRIIDYITTTSQENTKSAGHQFDIIVTALDEHTLSEEAQAIQNSNDSYFDNSNLSAWKIWYCLDNDTNRFAWAGDVKVGEIEHKKYDSSKCTINPELINDNAFITPFNFESCVWVDGNSDGFAYSDDHIHHDISELIYEWGHFTDENGVKQLCIYKSDADLYAEEGHPDYGDKYLYRGVVNVDGTEYDYWQKWDEYNNGGGSVNISGGDDYVYATTQRIVSNPEAYSATIEIENIYQPGKGVIYRMIDEWNNDMPYDFKNIQFYRKWNENKQLWSTISSDNTGVPCYTFSSTGNSATTSFTDMSLLASNGIYSNVIGKFVSSNKQKLNNICFFGNDCNGNTFGNNCDGNTFGNNCHSNAFGDYCYSNTFGNDCSGNIFGNAFFYSSFGNSCRENIFGNGGVNITFGNDCWNNTFGNFCQYNSFRNYCQYNSFGNYCQYNSFGNYCQYNSFGNSCRENIFGNYSQYNSFGNFCRGIKFASDSSASAKYDYYRNNHFGDGCAYIRFTGIEIASEAQQVQNYNFAQGLQGTMVTALTINGIRNRNFETKVEKNSNGDLKIFCLADLIIFEEDIPEPSQPSYPYSTNFIGDI